MPMNARYLTDDPIDGSLHSRRGRHRVLRQSKNSNLRPALESVGWVLAGATLGSVAVMLGAWGLANLTDPHRAAPPSVTAMAYQSPAMVQR